jgi:hypothetical protein
MPSDVFSGLDLQSSPIDLHVEGLPLRHFEGQARDTYTRAIPAHSLVSLRMAYPTPPLTTRLSCLKNLLLQSHRLQSFYYRDRGQGTYFTFASNERFPAFRKLTLRSYDWNHDAAAVRRHWDFSQLRSLELTSVPLFNFLSSVPPAMLSGLRVLRVEDFSAHLPDRRREASRKLHALVKNHINELRLLQASCHLSEFPIDALLAHASTLANLRLNDFSGFADDDLQRCPTIPVEDVQRLAEHCKRLHTLELDLDTRHTDVKRFRKAICAFSALDTLVLHVPTAVNVPANELMDDALTIYNPLNLMSATSTRPDHTATAESQRDANAIAARAIFQELLREKDDWHSITVNLGGWRPVMIRRMGDAWQQLNSMGVYAEQCFVWRRGDNGREMVMEELSSVEAQADP